METFYAVSADNRELNYDKYFKEGDTKRALIDEFNSNGPGGRVPVSRIIGVSNNQ